MVNLPWGTRRAPSPPVFLTEDGRVREDAARFLEQLHDKRIVDY
jgi:hypothetical protein